MTTWDDADAPTTCPACGGPLRKAGVRYCGKKCRDVVWNRTRPPRRKTDRVGVPSPPWVEEAVAALAVRAEEGLPLFPGPRPKPRED